LFDAATVPYESAHIMDATAMTNARVSWLNRLALALIWVVITAGIAFLVARNGAADDNGADVTAAAPPIIAEQRSAVTLTERTISPVVSGDGGVIRDGENDRWLLVAPAEPANVAYRLLDDPISVRALIDGGPAGFTCAWAGLGLPGGGDADASARGGAVPLAFGYASLVPLDGSAGQGGTPATGESSTGDVGMGVTMRCEIPDDVRVVAGLTGTMVLTMEEPTEAMALPVTAVVGSEGQGQVVVVGDDGATSVRPVELGRSDIFWIEVTGGLEEDEQVLEFPTQFDFGPGSA
jgi:hypothetical protein